MCALRSSAHKPCTAGACTVGMVSTAGRVKVADMMKPPRDVTQLSGKPRRRGDDKAIARDMPELE